jgi:large subunit ribosomal protein L16
MLFIPKNFKYKKEQKGVAFNKIKSNVNFTRLKFGVVGLRSLSSNRITSKQLVTLKQSIKKVIKKKGKLKINAFSFIPITKKAIGVRMGKGKGNVDHYVFKLKSGFVLCEIATNSISLAIKALNVAKIRLPISTKILLF